MAETHSEVNATPDQVYAILADGWTYSDWVVGSAHIRSVDPNWPATGASLHHKVGPWPVSIRDRSEVLRMDRPHRLVLRARVWPLGEASVQITITETGPARSRITMREEFAAGPLRRLKTLLNDVALHWRNRESLRRLGDLAERRTRAAAGPPPLD
jgi:uncharacterized protein YndB with AHSA1/START domain